MSHVASFRRGEFGIHQILAAASPGDAITNAALEYRDVLRRIGPSEVFARHIAPSSAGEVRPLQRVSARDGSQRRARVPRVDRRADGRRRSCCSRPEPIVLVYHNITPAKYFDGLDDTFAELLVLGRAGARVDPATASSLAIADSHFNAAELEAIGYEDVRVIPPVVDPFRLVRTDARRGDASSTSTTSFSEPMLLFVGQLLPHKRPDLLVKAMHVAATYLGVEAHAPARRPEPLRALRRRDQRADPRAQPRQRARGRAGRRRAARGDVPARGRVRDGERARRASASRCSRRWPSTFPVVARACAAIPETVGDGGLLLPPWAGAELDRGGDRRVVDDVDPAPATSSTRGRRPARASSPRSMRASRCSRRSARSSDAHPLRRAALRRADRGRRRAARARVRRAPGRARSPA